MAANLWSGFGKWTLMKAASSRINIIPVRFRTHRKLPTKKPNRPFMQRRTDFIKQMVLALVQHERIQTTLPKAIQLKKYGDLVRFSNKLLFKLKLMFSAEKKETSDNLLDLFML